MGRPERPVDPDRGPLHQFAAELRALRREAGNPTYRELSERSHYSPSALSRAASGHSLPTLAVIIGFVTGCGADPEPWRRRWREVADAVGLPDEPESSPAEQAAEDDEAALPEPSLEEPSPPSPPPRFAWARTRSARIAASVAAGALLLVVAAAVIVTSGHPASRQKHVTTLSSTTSEDSGLPAQPVTDGVDPKRSGCGQDGVSLDSVPLIFPADRLAGTVELRYSPRCRVAWTRFVPAPTGRGAGDTVTVAIARPSDSVEIPFTITYGDEAVWSDVLRTSVGCVQAKAWVVSNGQRSPAAVTGCRTGKADPSLSR